MTKTEPPIWKSLIELLEVIDADLMGADETIDGYFCSPLQKRIQAAITIVRQHFEGRTAVPGKPLELMTRDELLAYIREAERSSPIFSDPKEAIAWLKAHSDSPPDIVMGDESVERVSEALKPFLYDLGGPDLHIQAARAAVAAMSTKSVRSGCILNESSTQDVELLSGYSEERPFSVHPENGQPPDKPSEISDTIINQIADYIWRKIQLGESGVSRAMIGRQVKEVLNLYVAPPVPVMSEVNIEKGVQAAYAKYCETTMDADGWTEIVKACASAWGLKWK